MIAMNVKQTILGILVVITLILGGVVQAGTMVTNNSSADTCIREAADPDANYGTRTWLELGYNSSSTLRSWTFIKWDLSGIDQDAYIVDSPFQVYQSNWGPVGQTVDVYAVDNGDWSETSVTWNSWDGMTTSLDYLGSFIVKHYTEPCVFTSPALTEWTRNWIAGNQENYGLLLKNTTTTTNHQAIFYPREDTNHIDPQLIVNVGIRPAPGTTVTNNSSADTCIREAADPNANYGTRTWLELGYNSSSTLRSWTFIKWNLSDIAQNTYIDAATFQVYQRNWGPVGQTVDVYAVDNGDWSETSVTWNSWDGMTTSLDYLGSFIVKHNTEPCVFTSRIFEL